MKTKTGLSFSCPVCQKPVYRYPSEVAKGCSLTCSRECRSVLQHKGQLVPCGVCGKPFYQRASQARQGYGATCSQACHFKTRKNGQTFHCKVCGKAFYRNATQIKNGETHTCSKKCAMLRLRRFRKRGAKNMFTQWQKREWKEAECSKCGSTEHLELDHIIPRFAGGNTERDNAQTLCRTCNRIKFWEEDLPYFDRLFSAKGY